MLNGLTKKMVYLIHLSNCNMCNIIKILEGEQHGMIEGYKLARKIGGKYYSPFTYVEYKEKTLFQIPDGYKIKQVSNHFDNKGKIFTDPYFIDNRFANVIKSRSFYDSRHRGLTQVFRSYNFWLKDFKSRGYVVLKVTGMIRGYSKYIGKDCVMMRCFHTIEEVE